MFFSFDSFYFLGRNKNCSKRKRKKSARLSKVKEGGSIRYSLIKLFIFGTSLKNPRNVFAIFNTYQLVTLYVLKLCTFLYQCVRKVMPDLHISMPTLCTSIYTVFYFNWDLCLSQFFYQLPPLF